MLDDWYMGEGGTGRWTEYYLENTQEERKQIFFPPHIYYT
jgi:hypothetical protein